MSNNILEVKNLKTSFAVDKKFYPAVEGVNFEVRKGETLGVVGESGSGKSVTALSIMRLIPSPPGIIEADKLLFEGTELLKLPLSQMKKIRGNRISMIFQEPSTALNPVYTVGVQVAEALKIHMGLKKKEGMQRSVELFRMVGIPNPERRINEYPHQLSGGMKQRVVISIALACNPKMLIADEPTTALDVTIQAQILELLKSLKEKHEASIMMITHDLGVIAEIVDRIIVMYSGRILEVADVDSLFENRFHPYTEGLLNSIPRLDENVQKLHVIKGNVPSIFNWPQGCKFHPRCEYVMDDCKVIEPDLLEVKPNHLCRCLRYQ